MIQHAFERAQLASGIDQVLVATDDERIADVVKGFGGAVVLSREPFRTGTDRVARAAQQLSGHIFVNLQGDEILLHPAMLTELVASFRKSGAGMGTLKRALTLSERLRSHDAVKVITDQRGIALYFSRAPIPHVRDGRRQSPVTGLHYLHLGIYSYTRETLFQLAELPSGVLEEAEKLEQLRALEHGIPIRVWETKHPSLRIDTPDDLVEAELALQQYAMC